MTVFTQVALAPEPQAVGVDAGQVQTPALQVCAAPHLLPQVPQLLVSVWFEVQVLPQRIWPVVQHTAGLVPSLGRRHDLLAPQSALEPHTQLPLVHAAQPETQVMWLAEATHAALAALHTLPPHGCCTDGPATWHPVPQSTWPLGQHSAAMLIGRSHT